MGARNGKTVYDLLTSGWTRKLVDRGGSGLPHVNIPAEYAQEHNITIGDQVAVKQQDGPAPVLELHFDPEQTVEEDHE